MEALLNEWLWQEQYWLPPGIGWQDTEMTEDEGHFPLPRDLIYALPLAFAFIVLRYVFERCEYHSYKPIQNLFFFCFCFF